MSPLPLRKGSRRGPEGVQEGSRRGLGEVQDGSEGPGSADIFII